MKARWPMLQLYYHLGIPHALCYFSCVLNLTDILPLGMF